ncbi:MAG: nuclear transport factor 2 family protein [Solirubrobacterales bacterium]
MGGEARESRSADAEAELGRLSHRYATTLDGGDGAGFARLFLPDGLLTVCRGGSETDRFEGSAAIAAVPGRLAGFDRTAHAVLAHSFELGARTARGDVATEAHHLRWGEDGHGVDAVLHGRYDDEYGLDEEGRWGFRRRRFEVEWVERREVEAPAPRRERQAPGGSAAELADRRAIADLVLRYCRAVDRLDPEGIRACYHPDGTDRHTGFHGRRDEFVEWVAGALDRFEGTMHLVGNHHSEVEGERARAETYGLAFHWGRPAADPALNFVSAFRYVDRLERREGEWRLLERVAVREWTRRLDPAGWIPPEGDPPRGSRGGDDPVYAVGFRRFGPLG